MIGFYENIGLYLSKEKMAAKSDPASQIKDITWILFDLDGTVLYLDPPGVDTFHTYAGEFGVPITPRNARNAERWINRYWAQSKELEEDTRRFGPRENNGAFWRNHARRHLNALGVNGKRAEALAGKITERMIAEYQPKPYVPLEIYQTLDALKVGGYDLGMVSNRQAALHDVLEEFELSEFFEVACSAGEIGYWKPDPRILHTVGSEIGLELGKTAYVGDNFYADVRAARKAGVTPVLLDPKGLFPQVRSLVIRRFAELRDIFR